MGRENFRRASEQPFIPASSAPPETSRKKLRRKVRVVKSVP